MCLGENSIKPGAQCYPLHPHKTGAYTKPTQLNFVWKFAISLNANTTEFISTNSLPNRNYFLSSRILVVMVNTRGV